MNLELILGGAVTGTIGLVASIVSDKFKEGRKLKEQQKLLIVGILDDLEHSKSIYDKIEDEHYKTGLVYPYTLDELKASRHMYESKKDEIVILEDSDLRKDIFEYYLKSRQALGLLEYNKDEKFRAESDLRTVEHEIRQTMQGLYSLKSQSVNEIDGTNKLEQEYYNQLNYCEKLENKIKERINYLDATIRGSIAKLTKYRNDAKDLIKRLRQINKT